MRSSSRHFVFRRRPHLHQTCEATDRNVIHGRFGQASEPNITKPFPVDRPGKWRACAGKVCVLIRGELESGSGSRLYAESRSRGVRASWRFQQSAEAIVRTRHTPLAARKGRTVKNKEELPMNSDRGAWQRPLDFAREEQWARHAKLFRTERTDPARSDQPALSASPSGDSGAELAPLRGTAWCGPARRVVWGPGGATRPATRFTRSASCSCRCVSRRPRHSHVRLRQLLGSDEP